MNNITTCQAYLYMRSMNLQRSMNKFSYNFYHPERSFSFAHLSTYSTDENTEEIFKDWTIRQSYYTRTLKLAHINLLLDLDKFQEISHENKLILNEIISYAPKNPIDFYLCDVINYNGFALGKFGFDKNNYHIKKDSRVYILNLANSNISGVLFLNDGTITNTLEKRIENSKSPTEEIESEKITVYI